VLLLLVAGDGLSVAGQRYGLTTENEERMTSKATQMPSFGFEN